MDSQYFAFTTRGAAFVCGTTEAAMRASLRRKHHWRGINPRRQMPSGRLLWSRPEILEIAGAPGRHWWQFAMESERECRGHGIFMALGWIEEDRAAKALDQALSDVDGDPVVAAEKAIGPSFPPFNCVTLWVRELHAARPRMDKQQWLDALAVLARCIGPWSCEVDPGGLLSVASKAMARLPQGAGA